MLGRDHDSWAHSTLASQTEALESIVRTNPVVCDLLEALPGLGLPDWYLGAGGVAQTVWNHLHGFPATNGIADYDVAYYDPDDLSEASEQRREVRAMELLGLDGVKLDFTNEARVHLWYEQRFGRALSPYRSAEHAIATWPSTATSIGVRVEQGQFLVCAPFGLSDLFAMVVRPNTSLIPQAVYEAKAARWRRCWPRLAIRPWP